MEIIQTIAWLMTPFLGGQSKYGGDEEEEEGRIAAVGRLHNLFSVSLLAEHSTMFPRLLIQTDCHVASA